MKSTVRTAITAVAAFAMVIFPAVAVRAASTPNLTETVNAGTLTTDISDGTNPVASPSYAMTATSFSFSCLTGGNASTGTLGSDTQRIYITNPSAVTNFSLTIAPTAGNTASWTSGSNHIDYNDGGTSGCSDSDTDGYAGQLTINPSAGTLTSDCNSACSSTGITLGSQASFNGAGSVTLVSGAATDKVYKGYLKNATMSQTVPAQAKSGSYSLPMTLTITGS